MAEPGLLQSSWNFSLVLCLGYGLAHDEVILPFTETGDLLTGSSGIPEGLPVLPCHILCSHLDNRRGCFRHQVYVVLHGRHPISYPPFLEHGDCLRGYLLYKLSVLTGSRASASPKSASTPRRRQTEPPAASLASYLPWSLMCFMQYKVHNPVSSPH